MLETKIEQLTKAIEALTLVMQSATNDIKTDVKSILEQTVEPVIEETKALNYEDLRAVILKANRNDPDNKIITKEILTKYKANKVTEVSEIDISAVIEEIERLTK